MTAKIGGICGDWKFLDNNDPILPKSLFAYRVPGEMQISAITLRVIIEKTWKSCEKVVAWVAEHLS